MRLLHQSPLASGYPLQCHGLVIVILSRIMLAPYHIRVPKTVPLLELFSSKGGTFQFQRRNSLVPAEELFSSKGGTLRFQRWNVLFLKKVHSWEGITEMVLGSFLLVL